jgi:hypothetical protein
MGGSGLSPASSGLFDFCDFVEGLLDSLARQVYGSPRTGGLRQAHTPLIPYNV